MCRMPTLSKSDALLCHSVVSQEPERVKTRSRDLSCLKLQAACAATAAVSAAQLRLSSKHRDLRSQSSTAKLHVSAYSLPNALMAKIRRKPHKAAFQPAQQVAEEASTDDEADLQTSAYAQLISSLASKRRKLSAKESQVPAAATLTTTTQAARNSPSVHQAAAEAQADPAAPVARPGEVSERHLSRCHTHYSTRAATASVQMVCKRHQRLLGVVEVSDVYVIQRAASQQACPPLWKGLHGLAGPAPQHCIPTCSMAARRPGPSAGALVDAGL